MTRCQTDIMQFGGQGAALIFIHGIGGNAGNFRALAAELDGFCCRAVNLPGYGGSPPLTQKLDFAALSDWLGALITGLRTGPVHLVGHSIGGMVALEHAVRRPQQVASLTLIGSTSAFGGRDDSFKTAFLEQRLAPLEQGRSMTEIAEMTVPALLGPNADPAALAAAKASMADISPEQWRAVLACLVTFDRRADIERLELPVCLVAGGADNNAPARTMAKMAEKFPQAEFHCLEGIGHLLPLEAPAKIGQIIRQFIRS